MTTSSDLYAHQTFSDLPQIVRDLFLHQMEMDQEIEGITILKNLLIKRGQANEYSVP